MFRTRSRFRSLKRRASVMVETSLCLAFILLPITLGVVQYGIILSAMHQLDQLAREGGRYASVHAGEINFDSSETTSGSLRNYLKGIADGKGVIPWSDISSGITASPALGSRTSGQPLTVTITYSLKKKFFLASFPGMGFLSQTYTAKSTFVME